MSETMTAEPTPEAQPVAAPPATPAPLTFSFAGKTFAIGPRHQDTDDALSDLLAARELLVIRQFASRLLPHERLEHQDGWRRGVAAGHWSPGGPGFASFYGTPEGVKSAVWVRLAQGNKSVERGIIDRVFEDDSKWSELMGLFDQADGVRPAEQVVAA